MKVCGIIAEFNPFHKGHEYIISAARSLGADAVVVVMAGNITQRCEVACAEKHLRAKAAVCGGADLVIELPVRYAIGSAEKFATGAVSLLKSLEIIDFIVFGSECGDTIKLQSCADLIDSIDPAELKEALKSGESFAKVRSRLSGVDLVGSPNDILGVEYIRASNKLGAGFSPVAVQRTDSYLASASEIRKKIMNSDFSDLPEYSGMLLKEAFESGEAPASNETVERVILGFIRNCTQDMLQDVYGVNGNEGFPARILNAVSAVSLEDLYDQIKTKRYTMSAVKRAIMSAYLGIRNSDELPRYAHILAFSKLGQILIKNISEHFTCTHNLARIRNDFPDFCREECKATDLFALATPRILPGRMEFTAKNY